MKKKKEAKGAIPCDLCGANIIPNPDGRLTRCESCSQLKPDRLVNVASKDKGLSATLLCKIGSIVVHADEMLSEDGHDFDKIALKQLIEDPEVKAWVKEMGCMLPQKRKSG